MHAPYGKAERFGPRQRASTAAGTFFDRHSLKRRHTSAYARQHRSQPPAALAGRSDSRL